MVKKMALVRAGRVVNMIRLETDADYAPPNGQTMVEAEVSTRMGDTYDGSVFARAPVNKAAVRREKRAYLVQLLRDTDWTQLADIAPARRNAWATWRQAVRDMRQLSQDDILTAEPPTPPEKINED